MRKERRHQDGHSIRLKINNGIDCLLLNPPAPFTRYPYLGIALLASLLRKDGIRVEILDSSALGYTLQDTIKHIQHRKPRIIGITVMSATLRSSYLLIQAIKENYYGGVIVIGGAHIDGDPEIMASIKIPYAFWGECEYEFVDFCEQILGGQIPNKMPGLIINNNGELFKGKPNVVSELDALPMPAYDLLPLDRYYSPSTKLKTVSFISSRGCPYNCVFCSKLQQKPFRHLSIENITNQVEKLVNEFGIQWIEFVDEIFTLKRKFVIELCEAVIAKNIYFNWGCGTRADRIDEEMVILMGKAGCRKIGFGIETGVERLRFALNKRITNYKIIDAVKLCRKHGVRVGGSFIFGHPSETVKDMQQTIRFARKLPLNTPGFNRMIPIPNSDLFEKAKKSGRISKNVWRNFMLGKCSYPLFAPEGISHQTIAWFHRKAFLFTYLWPSYIWRNRAVLFSPRYFFRSVSELLNSIAGKRYR